MLIPARDRPFIGAKPSKFMEYHRLKDQDKVRETLDGWVFLLVGATSIVSIFFLIFMDVWAK